jgi:hypothetical protein
MFAAAAIEIALRSGANAIVVPVSDPSSEAIDPDEQ